ncbi:hypothetical protein [Neomoorella thermoacetica]|nr:hypothetical protein [Moorella thermoacetica]
MEMPEFHGVVKIVVDGKPQPPQLVKLSEWDKNRGVTREKTYSSQLKKGR